MHPKASECIRTGPNGSKQIRASKKTCKNHIFGLENQGRPGCPGGSPGEQIRAKIGQPLGQMLSALFAIDEPILSQAVQVYSREYVRIAASEERLFDGVLEMLQSLRQAGFQLGIATGKSQRGAENASRRLGLTEFFDGIHGIVPGTPGKPDPAVLLRAMSALSASASDCILVGDTTFDLDLAKAAGVRRAAVDWGVHSAEVLRGRAPEFFASTVAELATWLLQQK